MIHPLSSGPFARPPLKKREKVGLPRWVRVRAHIRLALADMGSHAHPPWQTYFLSFLQRWAGEGPGREWVYHSSALIYPLLAVAAMYFLAARFVDRPIWPS